jgi:hypothetical protein
MIQEKKDEDDFSKRYNEDNGWVLGQPWSEWWDEKAEKGVTDPGSARYTPSI